MPNSTSKEASFTLVDILQTKLSTQITNS